MFDEPGHGTRRAYDAVGSDGGSKAAADELDFRCVDIAGAVLPAEATAIGVGTEISRCSADEHGAGSGASISKFTGSFSEPRDSIFADGRPLPSRKFLLRSRLGQCYGEVTGVRITSVPICMERGRVWLSNSH
jgi:hypothetical protein